MAVSPLLTVDDLFALGNVPPDSSLSYGENPDQFGHLYLPENPKKSPVIILIHGGCWRSSVNLDYFGQAAKHLTQLGIAVWNIEYRRIGNGGGWPHTFLDVAAAADKLKDFSSHFSLDLSRVVAVGHSAGGHLAHWLAARQNLTPKGELFRSNPLLLKGFIALAGIPDLAEALKAKICSNEAPKELMGGFPESYPERYSQGSPSELAPLNSKQIFIQGINDDTVHLAYIEDYVAKAKARQEDIELNKLENTGHFELVIASTSQWRVVEQAIQELLEL